MRIFLDLHGVLIDLMSQVIVANQIKEMPDVVNVWSFDDMFGKPINLDRHTASWWANLPKTEEADAIVEECVSAVGEVNIYIATSALGRHNVASGSMQWVANHYPWLKSRVIVIDEKWHLGRDSNDILIDDSNHQVDAWDEKSEGRTILVPRQWNRDYSNRDPIGTVASVLKYYQGVDHG